MDSLGGLFEMGSEGKAALILRHRLTCSLFTGNIRAVKEF